jgi:hypothetical protein
MLDNERHTRDSIKSLTDKPRQFGSPKSFFNTQDELAERLAGLVTSLPREVSIWVVPAGKGVMFMSCFVSSTMV